MALPTVTVSGTFANADGTAPDGAVVFRLPSPMTDSANKILIPAGAAKVQLDRHGAFSIDLVPSNAGGLAPTPVAYEVTEQIGAKRQYSVIIPAGAPVNLADLAPLGVPPDLPTAYQMVSQKGLPGGYAALDSSGKVPSGQIPSIVFVRSHPVANQAAMLALAGVYPGEDLAIRLDGAGTFLLTGSDPTQIASWQLLPAPTDAVISVNGGVGAVALSAADVGADPAGAATTALTSATGRAIAFAVTLGA